MKRFIGLSMAIVLATSNLVFAESVVNTSVSVEVTSSKNNADSDLINELYPARSVGESLGYEVVWNEADKSIDFIYGDDTFTATVGSTVYLKNGKEIRKAPATTLTDGKSYIPFEFQRDLVENINNANSVDKDKYIELSENFLNALLKEDYDSVEKQLNGLLEIDQMKEIWNQISSGIGDFDEIEVDKYEVTTKEDEQIGTYIVIQQYAKFSEMGVIATYYFAENGSLIGIFFNFYEVKESIDELASGYEEVDYMVGVNKTQNAKLVKSVEGKGDTVVLLVAGSGPNDLDESIYGNTVFKDIAYGLAENGIDSFRFDKVTKAIQDAKYEPADAKRFTVQEEYLYDVKEITEMLKGMGYEHIYLLGHSQGGLLAPRLYEDNGGVYDGLILLAGSPRTLSDIGLDQATNQINTLDEENKKLYDGYIDAEKAKIENLDKYTDEELYEITIIGMPAYYIKEMNSYDAGEIAKNIDKPFLILQGSKDFQVFEKADYELWKEVLADKEDVTYVLYEDLGHLFTVAPENATNSVLDYLPAQKVDSRVINDIAEFINK